MAGATVAGGAHHGVSILSHAERVVAQNALDRLNSAKGRMGLNHDPNPTSATVFGGVKAPKLEAATLIHGHGNDTFLGGTSSVTTHALANIGNDTVVSGSATSLGHIKPEGHSGHGVQNFSLNSDTINVMGKTAEEFKGAHSEGSTASSHTISLSDKTKVTISGLSHHDIGKLPH
jgi:hypothetical protein